MNKFILDLCKELNALTTMDISFIPTRPVGIKEIAILREEKKIGSLVPKACISNNWSQPEEDKKYKWSLNYIYLGTCKKYSPGLAAKLLFPVEEEIEREILEKSNRGLGRERGCKLKQEVMQLLGVEKEKVKVMQDNVDLQTVAYTPAEALRPIIFAAFNKFSMRRLEYNGLKKTVTVKEIKKLRPLVKKILKLEQQAVKLFEEK